MSYKSLKLSTTTSIAAGILAVATLASHAETQPGLAPIKRPLPAAQGNTLLKEQLVKGLKAPDPAATSIEFKIAERTSDWAGKVQIAGIVKNLGGAYTSAPNQQQVHLYEIPIGGQPRLVASKTFQNLAAGQTVAVSFERSWNASSPAEGEFPPDYRVSLVYDPDIALDSNPANDDRSGANNMFERSGGGINQMFAQPSAVSNLTR